MTLDRMSSRPRAVTRPRPQTTPEPGRRAARVRPYHHNQQARVIRPARPAEPMRDRTVLERVLAGLRALAPQPTTRATVQPAVQDTAPPPVVGDSAATTTDVPPVLAVVSVGDAPVAPSTGEANVRSLLGRELMPLVRAVLARRPEAAVPVERVEPSPDVVRTQPLRLVEVGRREC